MKLHPTPSEGEVFFLERINTFASPCAVSNRMLTVYINAVEDAMVPEKDDRIRH